MWRIAPDLMFRSLNKIHHHIWKKAAVLSNSAYLWYFIVLAQKLRKHWPWKPAEFAWAPSKKFLFKVGTLLNSLLASLGARSAVFQENIAALIGWPWATYRRAGIKKRIKKAAWLLMSHLNKSLLLPPDGAYWKKLMYNFMPFKHMPTCKISMFYLKNVANGI